MKIFLCTILLSCLFFNVQSQNINPVAFNTEDTSAAKSVPCQKINCSVYVIVNKSKQRLFVFLNGALLDSFSVSTGIKGYKTPNMEHRFNGRMYEKYTSKKYPGGNYKGMGNMPYALFVRGGYAIHGTTTGNINLLGRTASHGCIRLHPDNAKILFDLVKEVGYQNTWVSIL